MITTIAANKQTNRDKMIDVVCGDNNTKIVRLVVPIAVDGVDLSGLMWHIKFINASGERGFHTASNIEIANDIIYIDWTIRGKATSKPGITQFQFEGLSDGDLVWQTSKLYLRVKDRIEVSEENIDDEENLTNLQQLIIYVNGELDNIIEAGKAARDAASHPPIIGENSNWFVYDWETKQYVDTGKPSKGSGGNGSGEDGGYYAPTVSDDGELTWKASKEDMPEIPTVNIRGQDGEGGEDGITPHIGDNGNWFIGDVDTGMPSCGEPGKDAEVDPTLSKSGAAADAAKTGEAINRLSEEIVDQGKAIEGKQPKGDYALKSDIPVEGVQELLWTIETSGEAQIIIDELEGAPLNLTYVHFAVNSVNSEVAQIQVEVRGTSNGYIGSLTMSTSDSNKYVGSKFYQEKGWWTNARFASGSKYGYGATYEAGEEYRHMVSVATNPGIGKIVFKNLKQTTGTIIEVWGVRA